MGNPSVTIQHKTGYVIAAVLFVASLFVFFLNTVMPSEQQDEQVLGYVIAGAAVVMALFFIFWGQCTETMNENGICIRRPFGVKQYPWHMVKYVGIVRPSGKDLPKIEIRVADRKSLLLIDYTKRSLACIQFYYGEPDSDKWGQPPALT